MLMLQTPKKSKFLLRPLLSKSATYPHWRESTEADATLDCDGHATESTEVLVWLEASPKAVQRVQGCARAPAGMVSVGQASVSSLLPQAARTAAYHG